MGGKLSRAIMSSSSKLASTCPFCRVVCRGGMSLVRHMCKTHGTNSDIANRIVDLMFLGVMGEIVEKDDKCVADFQFLLDQELLRITLQ